MLTLTYEYKLIPDDRQIKVIEHTLNICRSVWNYALRERKDWLKSRKSPVNACSIEPGGVTTSLKPILCKD
jgi:putative transposase